MVLLKQIFQDMIYLKRRGFFSCLSVVCFDAKINFDDNASFRQKEVFAMDDMAETDPREIEASRLKLNYIALEGSIGCLGLLNILHEDLSSWYIWF